MLKYLIVPAMALAALPLGAPPLAQTINPDAMIDTVMTAIAKSINRTKIEKSVSDLQKSKAVTNLPRAGAKRDAVFDAIKNTKAAKSGFISGVAELAPGAFSIPASAGQVVAQWMTKAQVAYAVARAYGQNPNVEAFKMDLFMLAAGDDIVREVVNELKSTITSLRC